MYHEQNLCSLTSTETGFVRCGQQTDVTSLADLLHRDSQAVERAERIVQRHSKRIGASARQTNCRHSHAQHVAMPAYECGDGNCAPMHVLNIVRAGFVQRFTIGFRGPLCLVSGFSGVKLSEFAIGASIGACITMTIQLTLVGGLAAVSCTDCLPAAHYLRCQIVEMLCQPHCFWRCRATSYKSS